MIRGLVMWLCIFCWLVAGLSRGATLRIAEFNVENYLDAPAAGRAAKSEAARTRVRDSILALQPDVISLEEMGSASALAQLQTALQTNGLDLPYLEHISAFDTNIHVAILSRFPFAARRPHTNDSFLLNGQRLRVSRGFAEVDLRVNDHFAFTLLAAHLKSKRPVSVADQADLRFEEAKLLREIIDQRLTANPAVNLVVLGDFNDTPDSEALRTIIGPRGKLRLIDTRPAEPNGDQPFELPARDRARSVTWTYFYAKDDTYSRIDYILLSHEMSRFWDPAHSRILALPNWGLASDHRPILVTLTLPD